MSLTRVHNRMIEGAAVNVKDFGAKGDGVTDDTAAIQAAIDSAPLPTGRRDFAVDKPNRGGAIIYIPAGSYKISTITVPQYVILKGDGEVTEIIVSGSIKWKATQFTNFEACWGIHIRDMHIRGSVGNEVLLTGNPFSLSGGTNNYSIDTLIDATFENVTFANASKGIAMQGGFNNTFKHCYFRNLVVGVELDGSRDTTDLTAKPTAYADDNVFIGCEFNNNIKSVRMRFAVGNEFIGCAFYNADEYHILFVDECVGNTVHGGRLEQTGTHLAKLEGGSVVLNGGTTYMCIADTNGISDAVTEPGTGSNWTAYWVAFNEFPAWRTWTTSTRYVPWGCRNNKFLGTNLFAGPASFAGKDGATITRSASFSFVSLTGDQGTVIRDCYSGNTVDYNIKINDRSFGARLYNNNYITSDVTGTPNFIEVSNVFDSKIDTYNGNIGFTAGSKISFTGFTNDIDIVGDTVNPDKLLFLTNSNEALHIRETTGVIHAPQNTFTATLSAGASSTVISVTNVSSVDVVAVFPKNAAAATFYGANTGSIYASAQANDKIRITHPTSATGSEEFNVILL